MKKKLTAYHLLIVSLFVRLFWLVVFEPRGARRAAAKTMQMGELAQFASSTIPFVVYPSIALLIMIIILSFMQKRIAYLAGIVFGSTHLILISVLLVMDVSPGRGFMIVIPSSLGMIIFSYLCYRNHHPINTAHT